MTRHAKSYDMTNLTEFNDGGGHVTLRGHTVAVDSDIGHAFGVDCCRFIENLIDEPQLRKKYGLLSDETWRQLETNEPLQLLVGRIKEERIRDGTAQREKAALRWNSAIDVIDSIVQDPSAPARHRLDGARELRACAGGEPEHKPNDRERFVININFGTARVHREIELTPRPPEPDDLTIDEEYRPTGLPRYSPATRGRT
jgi:hypothetical protein